MPVQLIFDNKYPDKLIVPAEMGTPKPDQLQGSTWDNLCELAGRVCYDSLGQGRPSKEYHEHIKEVVNLSVYRHATFTVKIPTGSTTISDHLLNRPSLWVELDNTTHSWRVTLNLQHIREWMKWGVPEFEPTRHFTAAMLGNVGADLAPLACGDMRNDQLLLRHSAEYVLPKNDRERWLSFFITGVSRGLSHELVRHTAYCAPSQRSTRYCDESESPWIWHPLLKRLAAKDDEVDSDLLHAKRYASHLYDRLIPKLMNEVGGNPTSARKAARGAARGVLGNALETELIFSASVAEWKHLCSLRNHPAADEEIREMAQQIEEVMKTIYPN
jgi:flavin-dependent thymidylate synthase